MFEIIEAILKLGLPSLLLAWMLFHWLFSEGEIDREVKHKVLKSRLKRIKKPFSNSSNKNARFVYNRWAWFGGGFYGLAGLWTFFIIEAGDLAGFVTTGGFLTVLNNGITDLVISVLINQVANSIQALLWFTYWPGPGESILIWIAAGYLGYWAGVEIARRQPTIRDILVPKAVVAETAPENISEDAPGLSSENNMPEESSIEVTSSTDLAQARENEFTSGNGQR